MPRPLETIDNQTMIVNGANSVPSSSIGAPTLLTLVRYTPDGSLDSGSAPAATPAP